MMVTFYALGLTFLAGVLPSSGLLIPPGSRNMDEIQVFGGGGGSNGIIQKTKRSLLGQMVFGSSDSDVDGDSKNRQRKPVPVTLGVMSKCPDAEICESVMDKTLQSVPWDMVDVQTVYIGELNDKLEPYGVECKHGSSECDGNVQQLCVAAHTSNQKDWWNFIQCQNFNSLNKVGDISLARTCSKVIKKDWEEDFSRCYYGEEGKKLLQESVKKSKKMDIAKSCTVFINNRLTCIHDGTWKECPDGHAAEDFERLIREEYAAINKLA